MKVVKEWAELPKDCIRFDHMNKPMSFGISMSFWPKLEGEEVENTDNDGEYILRRGASVFYLNECHVREVAE
jgi:hypothetical protein